MTPNAEPIEVLTVLASMVWLALVLGLLVRWATVLPKVARMKNPDAMRVMVFIRLVGYGSALLVAGVVFASGALQATSPRPISPSPWREVFQAGWLLIAVTQVMTIGAVDVMTRYVMRLLERADAKP